MNHHFCFEKVYGHHKVLLFVLGIVSYSYLKLLGFFFPPQDAELESKQPLKEVSIDTILEAQRQQQEERGKEKKKREDLLRRKGLNPSEHSEDSFA